MALWSGGTDSLNESRPSVSGGLWRRLGLALKAIHCHPRQPSHVTDDRACGISLTPDPETFPLSAPAVANGWPRTSVITDHWGSFVWVVNHIRKGYAGVTSETGELWPSAAGPRLWYLGWVCRSIDKIETHGDRWQIRLMQLFAMKIVCMKTDHTDKIKDQLYNEMNKEKTKLWPSSSNLLSNW